jgi:hypothetical protein
LIARVSSVASTVGYADVIPIIFVPHPPRVAGLIVIGTIAIIIRVATTVVEAAPAERVSVAEKHRPVAVSPVAMMAPTAAMTPVTTAAMMSPTAMMATTVTGFHEPPCPR